MIGGVAHSGRVILAAGAVMVAVFFTFALSGPLPPKEMGMILGVAVLLDAVLVQTRADSRGFATAGPMGMVAPTLGGPPALPTSPSATPEGFPVNRG